MLTLTDQTGFLLQRWSCPVDMLYFYIFYINPEGMACRKFMQIQGCRWWGNIRKPGTVATMMLRFSWFLKCSHSHTFVLRRLSSVGVYVCPQLFQVHTWSVSIKPRGKREVCQWYCVFVLGCFKSTLGVSPWNIEVLLVCRASNTAQMCVLYAV